MNDDPAARAEAAVRALGRLPARPGLSFRGGPDNALEPGEHYLERGFVPTSLDVRIATDNFAGPAVVALAGASGRDVAPVSQVPAELEVSYLPGVRFLVVGKGRVDGLSLTVAVVEDGAPEPDFEQLVATAVREVRAARAAAPVPLVRTGRFSGPIGVDDRGRRWPLG